MGRNDSLSTAYKNEFSTFYDQMPYGSAQSLEKMLGLHADWRGYVAAGFAYDLGLTGVVADHEKARACYHKAEDLGWASASHDSRITLGEFHYARHLDLTNPLLRATERLKAVYRVLLCIVMTSRGENAGRLNVVYTVGLAYSYRLARVVHNIPYEKDQKRQTGEDRAIAAAAGPMGTIMDLYSHQDQKIFLETVAGCEEAMNQGKTEEERAAYAFPVFLLGVMLFDTFRAPIDKALLDPAYGGECRKKGVGLLVKAMEAGCLTAAVYLRDAWNESEWGKRLIAEQLQIAPSAAGEEIDQALLRMAAENPAMKPRKELLLRALARRRNNEDHADDYPALW